MQYIYHRDKVYHYSRNLLWYVELRMILLQNKTFYFKQ